MVSQRKRPFEKGPPSDRIFGFVFACVFAILGAISMLRGGALSLYLFAFSALTLAVALGRPMWLAPLNRLWMRFGELLHRLVSPVVLGVIFFGVIAPFALVMKLFGRDSMRRRHDPEATSYWIARDPAGPDSESFRDQF